MARTKIDGHRQVMPGTITDEELAGGVGLDKLAEPVLQADGGQEWTGDQDAGGRTVGDLRDPAAPQDAATKAWVEAQVAAVPGVTASYHHVQAIPGASWLIVHNLGFNPAVTITDSSGREVEGEITYVDTNTVRADFAAAFAGDADLS